MNDNDDAAELLFFDTFSHEVDADINLDLVQFPKPVYITQVRIIPLGARVQADFPGGVRLGATNPSKFDIEFFVNDLGMPGASTFENLGRLEYNQNDCIHLECTQEKIPTDGLVLRGWYSTITLAVYGILTNSVNEHITSPPQPPPCEPAGPEEVCNIAGEAHIGTMLPEDITIAAAAKEEWKEPLPGSGELAHAHAHKVSVGEYERDDLEYGMTSSSREHYVHAGDERERERRMRKTSRSSDHSTSSRNRTHSESNERDFLRARSPDYSRHSRRKQRSERSRSDADEPHKWPRTPPASIDSPTRPRSPDTIDYTDEEPPVHHYKSRHKARSYARSNESLSNAPDAHGLLDDDEGTPGTPGEQYEPILSDDEIMGDDDSIAGTEQSPSDEFDESELQMAAASSAEPAIVEFDAFTMPIRQFVTDLHIHHSKELESIRMLFKKFQQQAQCADAERFAAATTTVDERECFVFLGEQLINHLAYLGLQFKRRYFVLQQFFTSDSRHLAQALGVLEVALSFEAACLQLQPAFKIRHIKVGARLTELLGASAEFVEYVVRVRRFDPFAALFQLYVLPYMALSIKLMLLKAVYALLDTRAGLTLFLEGKMNGYQLLLETLQQTQLTRTKYAIQAILKKLHLHEALACIHEQCTLHFAGGSDATTESQPEVVEACQLIERAMDQPLDALAANGLAYQQPRRFLPVSKKFEIVADPVAQRCFDNALQAFCSQHALAESLLLLLTNGAVLPPTLLLRCADLLHAMLQTHVGIDYLVDDCFETTQMIVAVLLDSDEVVVAASALDMAVSVKCDKATKPLKEESKEGEKSEAVKCESSETAKRDSPAKAKSAELCKESVDDVQSSSSPPVIDTEDVLGSVKRPLLHRLQTLGVEMAYKVQTRYHLDAIIFTASCDDYDAIKLASHLHLLYSQTCNATGRKYTVEMLGMNNNLQVLFDLIKQEQCLQAQRQLASPAAKYKSPVLSYAVDLVDCCVRHGDSLDYLIEHGFHLLELAKNHESFEPSVSAVLQEMFVYLKPLEAASIFGYDDITALVEVIARALEYITTFPGDLIMGLRILRHLAIGPASGGAPRKSTETVELRHRFVALQFYAADGVQTLLHILERLCTYFEQPGLHTPALVTTQGVHCLQIMLPTLQLLRVMLSFAIQCRDIEFKDLTAIDHLMKAYGLLHYFPAASQAANDVAAAKAEIIRTLLAYTQPNEQDEESLHKSLWTQMFRDVLKNIDAPSTFIPGLHVLSELLPLPLPMPMAASTRLLESQTQRLVTERKLWSAHLHPQSAQISKLIETIAPSSFPPLTALMTRICLQLADLAPNMTLLISKTLADLLCGEWTAAASTPTHQLARLLAFFARLTAYASLKSSALSILSGKLWELFQALLSLAESTELVLRCQIAVHRILESFLDSEISLVSPQSAASPELNLASALPPRDLIPRIVDAIVTNLCAVDVTHEVSALAVRNLAILTEHDITFYHLSQLLRQRSAEFQQWLHKVVSLNESGAYNSNIESLVLLLRSLAQIENGSSADANIPPRTLKLSPGELAAIVGVQRADQPPLLQRICAILAQNNAESKNALLDDVAKLQMQLEAVELAAIPASEDAPTDEEGQATPSPPATEPVLPQTEGIVTQYAARPIFSPYARSAACDELLSDRYWLESAASNDSGDTVAAYERNACDLAELASACLPPETNITSDCKRVLHLSASPQSNRERTPPPCFRTRRVEVEPSTGRPEKKIYVTPVRGRGFSRPPPSRGDLFRSRPPNTSRPPSLHVDDFLALETCGAQPTGPTGYNKIPPLMRGSRVGRNRGSRISAAAAFRKTKVLRTASPSTWNDGGSPHYRTATSEPQFGSDPHYGSPGHFSGRPRGRGGRPRSYLR